MPSAILPSMTEPPAICCVSARQLQPIITARADQERSVLRRWQRMIDDAAGRATHQRVEERRADRRVDSFEDEVYEQHSPVLRLEPALQTNSKRCATPNKRAGDHLGGPHAQLAFVVRI